jgi:hypothetical protein
MEAIQLRMCDCDMKPGIKSEDRGCLSGFKGSRRLHLQHMPSTPPRTTVMIVSDSFEKCGGPPLQVRSDPTTGTATAVVDLKERSEVSQVEGPTILCDRPTIVVSIH